MLDLPLFLGEKGLDGQSRSPYPCVEIRGLTVIHSKPHSVVDYPRSTACLAALVAYRQCNWSGCKHGLLSS